jgi:hypothetical protein
MTIALTPLMVASALAQPLWLDRSSDRVMSLEFVKPNFDDPDAEVAFSTAVWFLSARVAATNAVTVVGEAPFSNFSPDAGRGSSTIGNIYLGAEFHNRDAGVFAELGVRLPSVDDQELFAILLGGNTELVDRLEAFVDEALPVVVALNYWRSDAPGLVVRTRGGAAMWFPTGRRHDGEFFLLYGGQAGYSSDAFSVLAGITGRWLLTEDTEGIAEATFHHIGLAAGPRLGRVNPAFHMRIPMDEAVSDLFDFVWGVSVSVDIGS